MYMMYPDSGYKMTHAQSVYTRPFSRGEGAGDEANPGVHINIMMDIAVKLHYC